MCFILFIYYNRNEFYRKTQENMNSVNVSQFIATYDEIVEWIKVHTSNENTSKSDAEDKLKKMKRVFVELNVLNNILLLL